MNDEGPPELPIDVIGDSTARQILAILNVQRQSAKEIANHLDLSQTTVYRRIKALEEHGLIKQRTIVGPDGSHYNLYECQFVRATIHLRGTNYDVEIVRTASNNAL